MITPTPALLALTLAAALAACKPFEPATAPAAAATTTPATPPSATTAPSASETDGELLIALEARTLDRNSAGDTGSASCELTARATNHSAVEIQSLHAEFTVRTVADNMALPAPAVLTMPIRIAAGDTQAAWGPMYIDNHTCAALSIALNPTLPGACRTTSKAPCPAYALATTGIASGQ